MNICADLMAAESHFYENRILPLERRVAQLEELLKGLKPGSDLYPPPNTDANRIILVGAIPIFQLDVGRRLILYYRIRRLTRTRRRLTTFDEPSIPKI